MATGETPFTVRRTTASDGAALASLFSEAEALYERVPIKNHGRIAGSRFSIVALQTDDFIGGLISLWPTAPYSWLDGLAVARARFIRPVVDGLLSEFTRAMRSGRGKQVLLSATAAEHSHPPVLRAILEFGFRPLTDFRRFRKEDWTLPKMKGQEVELRQATHSDVTDLLRVEESAFAEHWRYDESRLRKLLAGGRRVTVAVASGNVVGYCTSLVDDGLGRIGRLAVLPAWQDLGIGCRLLADAIHSLRRNGADHVELVSQHGLDASWRLFEKFGFRPLGVDKRVYAFDLTSDGG